MKRADLVCLANGHTRVGLGPRGQRADPEGGALVIGTVLATVVLVVCVVGMVLLLVRRKTGSSVGHRLDQAAAALGFRGEDLGLRGRRFRGAWGQGEVIVSVTPGSAKAAEELVIQLPAINARSLHITPAHRLVAPLGAHPLTTPSSLGHLVALGDEATWRQLLASPTAQARLGEIIGAREGFETSLRFEAGTLELRTVGPLTARLDPMLLRRLLEACRAFTEALRG